MCRRSVLWIEEGEVNMRFNSIGSRILKVCERSECVADQCYGWGRISHYGNRRETIDRFW